MKYFLHDTCSFDDDNIFQLYTNFGYEGLGLFYTILEKIAKQEKPIKTSVLKAQLRVGKKLEKCWKYMEHLEIINTNNGETFNERILSYSKTYQIKKEKNAKRIAEWRQHQLVDKNVTHNGRGVLHASNAPKVNRSKENKEREEKVSVSEFFESEIEANKGHEQITKYGKLISYLEGDNDEKQVFKNILSLENQVSFQQYLKLKIAEKSLGGSLLQVLQAMENSTGLKKKYKSVFLTAKNWLQIRADNSKK